MRRPFLEALVLAGLACIGARRSGGGGSSGPAARRCQLRDRTSSFPVATSASPRRPLRALRHASIWPGCRSRRRTAVCGSPWGRTCCSTSTRPACAPRPSRSCASLSRRYASGGAATFAVEGHTDAKGGDGYNLKLSDRRARSVRDWLVTMAASPVLPSPWPATARRCRSPPTRIPTAATTPRAGSGTAGSRSWLRLRADRRSPVRPERRRTPWAGWDLRPRTIAR